MKKLTGRVAHEFGSDIDVKCKALIKAMHGLPRAWFEDVVGRDVADVPKVDVYVWGAPCQPWSLQGRRQGARDPRGGLAKHALRYITRHRPRVTIMENVANFARQFRPVLRKIARIIRDAGYVVRCRLLNTMHHGVPQRRQRVYLVAIRRDSLRRPFRWPDAVPYKRKAKALLSRAPGDQRLRIPERESRGARNNVKAAYRACADRGVDPRRVVVVTDTQASPQWRVYGVDVFPCQTASRGERLGWWLSVVGRRVTVPELLRFQGINDEDLDLAALQGTVVTDRDVGRMLGNAMSLNVLERVLAKALWAAALVQRRPVDRWQP